LFTIRDIWDVVEWGVDTGAVDSSEFQTEVDEVRGIYDYVKSRVICKISLDLSVVLLLRDFDTSFDAFDVAGVRIANRPLCHLYN